MPHLLRRAIARYLFAGSVAVLATSTQTPLHAARPALALMEVRMGGSITVREPAVPDCLDPQKTALGASNAILGEIVETLLSMDEQGHIRPYLADRYQFNSKGRIVTFFLHHGIRFSNGDPLDAAAVKFSFDRALNPTTRSPITAGLLNTIKRTEVVDPYTVRLVLKQPYRPLLTQLTLTYTGILDPRAASATSPDPCKYPVGSGPFMVQDSGPGFSTVTLVRNPLHTFNPPWAHHQGPAYLDRIIWKPIVSDSTATSDLLSGGSDIDINMSGTQLGRLRGRAITTYRIPEQGETFLGFNQAHAPFNIPSVRMAVAEAIDRLSVIRAAATGLAIPAYSPIPSTLPFYDRAADTYAPVYNAQDARRLITAYHATGPYTLLTFNFPEERIAAELIQAELADAGMQVKVTTLPLADYLAAAGKGHFDLNLLSWGWPDPDFLYQLFDSSEETAGGLNFTFTHDTAMDKMIARGRSTVSPLGAAHIYAQLQRYMDSKVIIDPLLTDDQMYAVRSAIHGWHTNSAALPLYQDLYLEL